MLKLAPFNVLEEKGNEGSNRRAFAQDTLSEVSCVSNSKDLILIKSSEIRPICQRWLELTLGHKGHSLGS